MRQFTSYLYEYDQGRRVRNVGFVRVQPEEQSCIVHIHGKGLRMQGEKNLDIYLFYEEDGKCIGIWQGTVKNVNPAINYRLTYTLQDDGMDLHYGQICGIILKSDNGRTYSAVWDDHMADVEAMKLWVKEFEYPRPERSDLPDEELEEAGLSGRSEQAVTAPEQSIGTEPNREARPEGEPERARDPNRSTETESNREMRPEWEEIRQTEEEASCRYKKIQRSDLAKLPRCEWRLANNSFLLHGYYNYKHLMFIREENRCLLGVPGIYHPREARAAATFGFVEFIPMAELDISWEKDPDEKETFGYWCRQVKEPMVR